MKTIEITEAMLTGGASIVGQSKKGEDLCLRLVKDGAGLDVTWLKDVEERYLTFWLEAETEHSVPVNILVYSKKEPGKEIFDIRFGVLPRMRTGICIDLHWMDAHALFPEACPGELKVVCHGRRAEKEEIEKILLTTLPLDGDIEINWSSLYLTREYPQEPVPSDGSALPDGKLVDELGQNRRKEWMNTLGNWTDDNILGTTGMPYVTSLPHFPSTKQTIFRDFPDVFSEEYINNAIEYAKALEARKNDPLMIGYFLRNEPAWAFVDHLVLADEVLYNPAQTACKRELIKMLREKYGNIGALNAAWKSSFDSFEDLNASQANVSQWSEEAGRDMRAFSRKMMEAYVRIPSRACREVDQNHMILGMRWAWISDPDVITGCHYSQCYDQFTLGRFDGENYNIGLFDICSQPYPEMMSAVKECSSVMYEVAAGKREPVEQKAKETVMIAF